MRKKTPALKTKQSTSAFLRRLMRDVEQHRDSLPHAMYGPDAIGRMAMSMIKAQLLRAHESVMIAEEQAYLSRAAAVESEASG